MERWAHRSCKMRCVKLCLLINELCLCPSLRSHHYVLKKNYTKNLMLCVLLYASINCIGLHIVHFWFGFKAVLWTKIRLLPASSIRRCSSPGWRKASSLHERICVPTSSELVASILALSSFRLTPAMEATSLMSSSSLSSQRSGKEMKLKLLQIRLD